MELGCAAAMCRWDDLITGDRLWTVWEDETITLNRSEKDGIVDISQAYVS